MRRALLLLSCLLSVPALAQVDPEIVRATAGTWFLADGAGKGCNLTLSADEAIGGYAVEAPAGCTVGTIAGGDIAAWAFADDGMILLDATRRVLFRLKEQEYGGFTGEDGVVLAPSEPGIVALVNARDLFGTWTMQRPGGPTLCTVTLRDEPPEGGEESFALAVADGCDPAVTALKLVSWRVEGPAVVLHGSEGRSLALVADGEGGLRKAAREGGKPLVMVRAR